MCSFSCLWCWTTEQGLNWTCNMMMSHGNTWYELLIQCILLRICVYSSVVTQIWLNHKEPRLITVALPKIWGTLFRYFYFWQLFRAIPAALCNNTVRTSSIMENFSESSRSSWYFNPTVFRIQRIQTWHTGDPVSGSCALTETAQVWFPGSEPT